MIVAVAIAMVFLVAAFVISPFLRESGHELPEERRLGSELWTREKAVAVLAITEADFDRATGKLTEIDYRVLRSDYEGRALHAMDELEKEIPLPTADNPMRFCPSCGTRFGEGNDFCGACGRRRSAA